MPLQAIPFIASKCLSEMEFQAHFGASAPQNIDEVYRSLRSWLFESADDAKGLDQLNTLWGRDNSWRAPALLNLLLTSIKPSASNFVASAMEDLQRLIVQLAKSWTTSSATTKPRQQQQHFLVQHISCLKLFAWTNFSFDSVGGTPAFSRDMQLGDSLWRGMQTANISSLVLGEFFSEDFITKLPFIHTPYLPRISGIVGLQGLQSLTLHLNLWGVYNLFQSGSSNAGNVGCLQVLHQLTSVTLIASEVAPNGPPRKHSIPADRLLHSLPYSIQSVSLCNFRQRWKAFHGLSCRPKLVDLDLSSSACILPPPKAWSQLQQLKLTDSLVWLEPNQPFQFCLLPQLSVLDLNRCAFRQTDRPHNLAHQHIQAPGSIASLNLLTKCVKVRLSMW